jgi:hypothetical protein
MDPADKARMKASLAEFGDLSGIVINRRTDQLVGGHQRADVLAGGELHVDDLPEPEPDGTVARGYLEHDGKRYTVRVVDWDDEKAKAALVAANRFGRVGADDPDLLTSLLAEIVADGVIDTDLTGFDADALAELLADVADEPADDLPAEVDADETWGVRVLCASEAEQRELFERLTKEGLKCETLM